MRNRILLLILLLVSLKVRASFGSEWEFLLSTTSLPISGVTSTDDAKKSFMGELYAPMGVKYNFHPYTIQLTTSMISLITNKDKDSGLKTSLTQLEGGYLFNSGSSLLYKTQMGIMYYEMKGSGGQKELRNGNSTMTFDLPSKTRNSQTFYAGLGTQYNFGSMNVGLDLNFLSPLSNTRRSYFLSLLFGVSL